MSERQLDSGIWIALQDSPAAPPPPPSPAAVRCVACGKGSPPGALFSFGRTLGGFALVRPTCRCGDYAVCPDCKWEGGCPACGCQEEYT